MKIGSTITKLVNNRSRLTEKSLKNNKESIVFTTKVKCQAIKTSLDQITNKRDNRTNFFKSFAKTIANVK